MKATMNSESSSRAVQATFSRRPYDKNQTTNLTEQETLLVAPLITETRELQREYRQRVPSPIHWDRMVTKQEPGKFCYKNQQTRTFSGLSHKGIGPRIKAN